MSLPGLPDGSPADLALPVPSEVVETPGAGVSGVVDGVRVDVGSAAFVAGTGGLPLWARELRRRAVLEGATNVFVGIGVLVGVGVLVLVGSGVLVGVGVFVLVGTGVFVGVGVFVLVGTGVFVGVGVFVLVGIGVLVGVFVAVLVGVGVLVNVGVLVGVAVFVGVAVLVGVLVGVAVGARISTLSHDGPSEGCWLGFVTASLVTLAQFCV